MGRGRTRSRPQKNIPLGPHLGQANRAKMRWRKVFGVVIGTAT